MPENPANLPGGRFDLLVQKYFEKSLDPAEADDLRLLLECDPGLGAQFMSQFEVDALLREAAAADRVLPVDAADWLDRGRRRIFQPGAYGWAVAAAVAMIAGAFLLTVRAPRRDEVLAEARSGAVAVIGDTVGAVWESGTQRLATNAPLEPGKIQLRSGIVRLDFFSGARVLLTGPAEFDIVGMDRAFCHSGKLSAEVPPQARGFTIGTPEGEVRDLGTAFGMNVGPSGSDVHVLEGEVEIPSVEPGLLKKGEAVRLVRKGGSRRMAADPKGFQLTGEVQRLSGDEIRRRSVMWAEVMNQMDADPALLARFSMTKRDGGSSFSFTNTSFRKAVAAGAIIGCTRGEGRWPDLSALQFGSLSDRVRVDIPGEFEALTFTAWVSVQSLQQRYSSLLMTEGFETGEVHWQIVDDGAVRIGIRPPASEIPDNFDSPGIITPATFGQWLYLAAVVDRRERTIRHYFNGAEVSLHHYPDMSVLRLGTANIGNWAQPSNIVPIRNFIGMMDEVTVHERPLSGDQIRHLYDAGCPSPGPD